MRPYLIALEGGGTRSQAVLMDMEGRVIQVGKAGDVNTNFTSFEQAQETVLRVVSNVLSAAQVPGEQVLYFVSSLVGAHFGPETFGRLCPNACYHYHSERDVVFARAGVYRPHGVALVAATGATAFAIRADDGREIALGGWGALLGDEGSAYHLGLLGLRAAVLAFEGRGEASRLVEGLCQHFHFSMENFHEELIWLAYRKSMSRTEIANVAALVTRLAQAGDHVALRLTAQVANDLAALMLHAARRLFNAQETFDVVCAGGMVNAGELLLTPLREPLAAEFPNAALRVGLEEPAIALGRLEIYWVGQQEEQC